jgi:alkaline phosphatase D
MQPIEVHPLTVGPIVGATTPRSVRLWGRGEFAKSGSNPRRCFGVVRLWPQGAPGKVRLRFFKMNPNFDFTGIAIFHDLEPETEYHYQMGWFFAQRELEDFGPETPIRWEQTVPSRFRTGSEDDSAPRSLVFGSCRYLLCLLGGWWFDDRGDKTFRSVLEQIEGEERRTDLFMMLGDQIYADDLGPPGGDERLDQYHRRYRQAFSQPHLRRLMSRVPTYTTLDDHEIEHNWPSDATRRDWLIKYPVAIHAFQAYQLSHSPLFELSDDGHRLVGVPERLWYTFRDGCCDFFVTDSRTERFFDGPIEQRRILEREQFEALSAWLTDGSGRVKLIVSSVPLFPDYDRRGWGEWKGADKWGGFLQQRTELLELIREQRLRKVAFLSGDAHVSLSSELGHRDDPDFRVASIISSPFFWPYPHPGADTFVESGPLDTFPAELGYEVRSSGPIHRTDNFTRLTVDPEKIRVEVFARKGELLGEKVHRLG